MARSRPHWRIIQRPIAQVSRFFALFPIQLVPKRRTRQISTNFIRRTRQISMKTQHKIKISPNFPFHLSPFVSSGAPLWYHGTVVPACLYRYVHRAPEPLGSRSESRPQPRSRSRLPIPNTPAEDTWIGCKRNEMRLTEIDTASILLVRLASSIRISGQIAVQYIFPRSGWRFFDFVELTCRFPCS